MTRNNRPKRPTGHKLTHEQQSGLRSDAHAFLRMARNAYLKTKNGQINLNAAETLSENRVIWTNTGFAIELMLKWVLYCDRQKVRPAHYTHNLFSIYNDMSSDAREASEKMYMGEFSYAMEIGLSEFRAVKAVSDPAVPAGQMPGSYSASIGNLPEMLKYIDKHKVLYDMRYASVTYNRNEWNIFMTGLDHLFSFINGLSRLVKFHNGNWGYREGKWLGFGIQNPGHGPDWACRYYESNGWSMNEEGHWTRVIPSGRIVVYCPEAYANYASHCEEQTLTKEEPYLHACKRTSREGGFSGSYLVARLIPCGG